MDVSFGNKKLRLNVFSASQGPSMDSYFKIDTFEDIIEEATSTIFVHDFRDTHLMHFGVDDYDMEGGSEEINTLLDTSNIKITLFWTIKYEPLSALANTPTVPSLESPPALELKPLPATQVCIPRT